MRQKSVLFFYGAMFCKLKIEGAGVVSALGFQQNPTLRKKHFIFEVLLIIKFCFSSDLIEIYFECLHHLEPILVEID